MVYNVAVSAAAESDLDDFLYYLLFEKQNEQAAANVLYDFEETVRVLSAVAGSLKYCDHAELARKGYRRLNFLRHDYFIIYRVAGNTAEIVRIFHASQDYENKMV